MAAIVGLGGGGAFGDAPRAAADPGADQVAAPSGACGDGPEYRASPSARAIGPRRVKGRTPKFRDVSGRVGLTFARAPLCGAPGCLLSEPELRAEFPGVSLPVGDALNGALCQLERFTGGVAVGDANQDGLVDVYVPRLDGPGRLMLADDDGFHDATAGSGLEALPEASVGAAFADIDNDGDEDLFVSTIASHRYYLFVNEGSGRFTEAAQARGTALENGNIHIGYSIAVGDYDRDGFVDVYFTEYRGASGATPIAASDARLLHNRGEAQPGYFDDVTTAAGVAIERTNDPVFAFGATFADLDRDGWQDLLVAGDFGTSHLFWNRHDGTFAEGTKAAGLGTEENGMGLAVGDVNGDGLADVMVTSIFDPRGSSFTDGGNWGGSGNRLFLGLGKRTFRDATDLAGVRNGGWGWGTAMVDTMNRGRRDLLQVSGVDFPDIPLAKPFAGGRSRLWRNDGKDGFTQVAGPAGFDVINARGLAVLDQNRDGRLDVIAVQPGARPVLLRNTSRPAHYLRVEVRGTSSNRDGLGAVVSVRPKRRGPSTVIEVGTGTAFLGQSERAVQVGLGTQRARVDRVQVRFPASGKVVTMRNVKPDRTFVITEPT